MSVTDADRIAAAGIPLTLGGREVRVRYTLRSWKEAEDRFGSLEGALAVMRGWIAKPDSTEPPLLRIGEVVPLLWMGLLHEGLTEDDVYALGSIRELNPYTDAILAAVSEGTPGPGPGKDEAQTASPGATTTTQSQPDGVAAMASSGV